MGECMENNILVEIIKKINDDIEKIKIYKNGEVDLLIKRNGIINEEKIRINFVKELENELIRGYDALNFMYVNKPYTYYKIKYNNQEYNSFDLYSDLLLMIKNNQFKSLSVFKQYDREKLRLEEESQKINDITILDQLEKNKMKIDISDCTVSKLDFNEEREIITFSLKENSTFKLGESRFFSDTIDLSDDIEIPKGLEFVGQINLSEIAKHDTLDLLPKTGMLYFFQSPLEIAGHYYEFGKVIYSENMDLKRKQIDINESNEFMIRNFSLENINKSTEKFQDRYVEYDGFVEYDYFKGEELNKIYGFYSSCQMEDEDIIKVSNRYIVLLQLGADIYGEGVTTFMIPEEDLKNKNFDNIIFTYVQS